MPRRKVEFKQGGVYHIFSRSQGRGTIFDGVQEYWHFAGRLMYLVGAMGIELDAWCLLPNHFHLLIKQTGDTPVSKFLHRLLTGFAKRYNFFTERSGHVFEHRFGAKEVDTDEYYGVLCQYISNNAVRHNLVEDARDWPFSSYGEVISGVDFSKFSDDENEFDEMDF